MFVCVLLMSVVAESKQSCSSDNEQCSETAMPFGFAQCRDRLFEAINPMSLLTKELVHHAENIYEFGLWDLTATCDGDKLDAAGDISDLNPVRKAELAEAVLSNPIM